MRKPQDSVMSEEMFHEYAANPIRLDADVRKRFQIPENKYYTVAMYPPHIAGTVTVERERVVRAHKISKSDIS